MTDKQVESSAPAEESILFSLLRRTPWLLVSTLSHVLIIALVSVLSLSLITPESDDLFLIECPFDLRVAARTSIKNKPIDVYSPGTAPSDKGEISDIVVPPDILAQAVVGDHFESAAEDLMRSGDEVMDAWKAFRNYSDDRCGGGMHGNSLDDMQTGVGGPPGPGRGGGWGSRDGGDIDSNAMAGAGSFGSDTGKGRGSFGRRLWITIESALKWLAAHQEADGHWDAIRNGSAQKIDTAVTALALMAFSGAGHTERVGKFKDNVKRAVMWLKSRQQSSGLIFDSTDAGGYRGIGYPHAIATLALAEAAGMHNIKDTRAAAQRAVDYATGQVEGSEQLGWRYAAGQSGDLSVTGWYVMALKSAKLAGLHVDPAAFQNALKFLETVEIKDPEGGASRFRYQPSQEHANSAHLLTAIGTHIRQSCGWPSQDTQASAEWFIEKGGVPNWDAKGESVDLYYWFYGTLCSYNQGGDVSSRWHEAVTQALTNHQCKDADNAGSWPVVGEFSDEWGRVGQTALSALCLEIYYRYDKLKN